MVVYTTRRGRRGNASKLICGGNLRGRLLRHRWRRDGVGFGRSWSSCVLRSGRRRQTVAIILAALFHRCSSLPRASVVRPKADVMECLVDTKTEQFSHTP